MFNSIQTFKHTACINSILNSILKVDSHIDADSFADPAEIVKMKLLQLFPDDMSDEEKFYSRTGHAHVNMVREVLLQNRPCTCEYGERSSTPKRGRRM
jgi:hypothetical protein